LAAATTYEAVIDAERNPELFSNAGGIRPDQDALPMMIDMDDPAHLLRRKLVNAGFTRKRLKVQDGTIGALCDWLIDAVCERGECDFVHDIAAPLPMAVIGDTEFHGTQLRKGEKMMLMFESANFDEKVFGDPDDFNIRRDPNSHLAFGFGTHFCLGNQLARIELVNMTRRVLQRLPDLQLADDVNLPLRPANFVSGLESMPVTFTPTKPVLAG
jgi:cytochrome P450